MLELRYPGRSLLGDWLRTAIGLGIGLGVLLFTPFSLWILAIFGAVVVLFAIFGLRTLERQLQVVALGEAGVAARDWRSRAIAWEELQGLRLRFYGTRRQQRRLGDGDDPGGGFLELTLRGPRAKLVLESSLPGFGLVAWRATQAAREAGLRLEPATAGNLLTLGIDPDKDTAPPEMSAEWAQAVARP